MNIQMSSPGRQDMNMQEKSPGMLNMNIQMKSPGNQNMEILNNPWKTRLIGSRTGSPMSLQNMPGTGLLMGGLIRKRQHMMKNRSSRKHRQNTTFK